MRRFLSEHAPDDETPRRSRLALWSIIGILASAVVGLYVLTFQEHVPRLAQIPNLGQLVNLVGARVEAVEAKLRRWDQERIESRLATVEAGLERSSKESARQAKNAGTAVARLGAQMGGRAAGAESRLAQLESEAADAGARLERVQGEMARVRGEVAQQQARMESAERNQLADKNLADERISGLRAELRHETGDRRQSIARIDRSLSTRRIDFEVTRGRSTQLAEGISLGITGTDVRHRRVNGWMWIMPDRKTVWLREHGALQPVVFYSSADGKRREVVFTHVTESAVVGYLLLPA